MFAIWMSFYYNIVQEAHKFSAHHAVSFFQDKVCEVPIKLESLFTPKARYLN